LRAGRALEATRPVQTDLATRYRVQGLWDDRDLRDGVEAAALRHPDAVAVDGPDAKLTYADLAQRVGGAVVELGGEGVRPGDVVLLLSGNTASGVTAYHALLRVGATVVFLDRRCGRSDIEQAAQLLSEPARSLIASREVEGVVKAAGIAPLHLESLDGQPLSGAPDWLEPDRERPALVLFTSGTTARPRGVMHSLNTLTAGARNMGQITQAEEGSVLFLVSPLSSVAGVMQMHLAADIGAALVLEDSFDAAASYDRLNAKGGTLLGGAPVIAEQLLGEASRRDSAHLSLRTLALGGAMLPPPLLDMATDQFGIDVARVYGSTEAPNFSGSNPTDPRDVRLADDGQLQPGSEARIGSSGHPKEGLIRGPGVCLGYVEESDSAEAFEDGWFRTGDLFEVRDGRLTVMGRLKEIVNRNGLKISLAEIDAALSDLRGAKESAGFAVPDTTTGERLAVAVVAMPGAMVTLDDVVDHLLERGVARRKLPEQLVVHQDALPRTTSGKVIRARLA
jgi:acyl-CoA synthetase (AMP-forming)/AMP-acid ligase II